ncbi:hypothetical protein LTR37_016503 [Vermiconidia calcicola]|uniref:Uncharacterized protein n=1 Tax=Vermiconidia calcicola TaxID=1690605 RepID=A0ACC3MMP3_9PEZI|nr:hypothetical protein LTR37_016503 [Vermiconidia calcicola]
MTKTEYALAYAKCTTTELQQFIEDHGVDVKRTAQRKTLIRALRQADPDAVFEFLRLPPEMRPLIHEELLTTRRKSSYPQIWYCWPSILTACRQVHQESSPVLYKNATINVTTSLNGRESHHVEVYVNDAHVRRSATSFLLDWPAYLPKISGVHLTLDLNQPNLYRFPMSEVNEMLHELVLFLRSCNKLEKLEIEISLDSIVSDETNRETVAPIIALGAMVPIALLTPGGSPAAVVTDVERSISALRKIREFETEATLYLHTSTELDQSELKRTCLDIFRHGRIDVPARPDEDLYTIRSLLDLKQVLGVLEAGLDEISDEVMESSIKGVIERRKKKRETRESQQMQEV